MENLLSIPLLPISDNDKYGLTINPYETMKKLLVLIGLILLMSGCVRLKIGDYGVITKVEKGENSNYLVTLYFPQSQTEEDYPMFTKITMITSTRYQVGDTLKFTRMR